MKILIVNVKDWTFPRDSRIDILIGIITPRNNTRRLAHYLDETTEFEIIELTRSNPIKLIKLFASVPVDNVARFPINVKHHFTMFRFSVKFWISNQQPLQVS